LLISEIRIVDITNVHTFLLVYTLNVFHFTYIEYSIHVLNFLFSDIVISIYKKTLH